MLIIYETDSNCSIADDSGLAGHVCFQGLGQVSVETNQWQSAIR